VTAVVHVFGDALDRGHVTRCAAELGVLDLWQRVGG
jgi:hypothetical protein